MYSLLMFLLCVLLALLSTRVWLPVLGRLMARAFDAWCGEVGWVDGVPYQCVHPPYHSGPHQSAWHPTLHIRVRWFDGEHGQASSVERKPILPVPDL